MTLSQLIHKAFPTANVAKLVREERVTLVRRLNGWGFSEERASSPRQGVKRVTFVDVSIPGNGRSRIRWDGSIDLLAFW